MEEDLISIIIPVYNVSEYLEQCIDSIINQTYKNIEIIIIDDGSTDNCLDIIKKYSIKDKRIKYYTRENRGLLYTRIDGVKKSTGKYIMFVDSDDWLEINATENLYKKMKDYSADMVKCSYRKVGKYSSQNIIRKSKDEIYENETMNKMYFDFTTGHLFHSAWSQLIKSNIIRKYIDECDYSISMGEDIELNIHLLNHYKRIVVTGDVLYNYRWNNNSISNALSYEKVENRINDLIKVYGHFLSFILVNSPENYNNALIKVITNINNNILTYSNIQKLKIKKIKKIIENVFKSPIILKIIGQINKKDLKKNGIIKYYLFLVNIYYDRVNIYLINLLLLNKLKLIKNKLKRGKK